jgi:hypothetical protein
MGLFNFLLDKAEGTVQHMARDNAWRYVRVTCGLNVNSLPASLVDDSHARMVAIYDEMARHSGVKPFNVAEEAALRVAFVAARGAVTKTADPGELAVACSRILAEGRQDIGPMCLYLVAQALDSVSIHDSVDVACGERQNTVTADRTGPLNAAVRDTVQADGVKKTEYITVAESQKARGKLLVGK